MGVLCPPIPPPPQTETLPFMFQYSAISQVYQLTFAKIFNLLSECVTDTTASITTNITSKNKVLQYFQLITSQILL